MPTFESKGCDKILHMLGRSMNFFLLVIWEDGRDRLEKAYGSNVSLRRSKGHLSNEVGNWENKMFTAGTGIRICVNLTYCVYKHLY